MKKDNGVEKILGKCVSYLLACGVDGARVTMNIMSESARPCVRIHVFKIDFMISLRALQSYIRKRADWISGLLTPLTR